MNDPKRYDPFIRSKGYFDGMEESPNGEWVKWTEYESLRKRMALENISWIGEAGEQSAKVAKLEAQVAKMKEDRQFLAQSIEALLPVSIDKFAKAVLKKKPKKKHG